jgi:hypothetical protein
MARWPRMGILGVLAQLAGPMAIIRDEVDQQIGREAMGQHDCFGGTVRGSGEQAERPASFHSHFSIAHRADQKSSHWGDAWISWRASYAPQFLQIEARDYYIVRRHSKLRRYVRHNVSRLHCWH